MARPDYLLVGHVTWDLTPAGPVAGGAVTFAGRAARALGCRVAVLTSASPDYDFQQGLGDGIEYLSVEAGATTTFANSYTATGRRQQLHSVAETVTADHLPPDWQRPSIVHLAPVANEVDPAMIGLFSNSLIGLTPQGWLRRWDDSGRVYACPWPAAAEVLPLAAAVILSEEDLTGLDMLAEYRQYARLLVLTQGAAGCTVFCRDETRQVAAPAVTEVNPTGAGDIFAAAFLVRYQQTAGNPWEAARFANEAAAYSVTQADLSSKVEKIRHLLTEGQ
jgi:sugar/nucleoside kinase (ribokinase family)